MTASVDYNKFAEWVGLGGPMPSRAALATYLEIELDNREEVDSVEYAVLNEAIRALREAGDDRWRHKKRGTEYVKIGAGKMQAEHWRDPDIDADYESQRVDMREVIIYRAIDDGELWVRPREEFEDGRFERVTSGGAVPTPIADSSEAGTGGSQALREALQGVRAAILEAPIEVLTCTLWMPPRVSPNETVVDYIDAALDADKGGAEKSATLQDLEDEAFRGGLSAEAYEALYGARPSDPTPAQSGKSPIKCDDCGKMYPDHAPEGDPVCECAARTVRALKEATMGRPDTPAQSAAGEKRAFEIFMEAFDPAYVGEKDDNDALGVGIQAGLKAVLAALSAPVVEPVAWRCFDRVMETWSVTADDVLVESRRRHQEYWIIEPLYTHPPAPAVGAEEVARVTDNDDGEISVSVNGKEIRGWSYSSDQERRTKMLCAREFVEGFYSARQR